MLLMYSALHCLYSVANKITTTTITTNILGTSCEIAPQVNATEPHWWYVNIGSGNDVVSPGNKPLPDPALWSYISSLYHNQSIIDSIVKIIFRSAYWIKYHLYSRKQEQ